MLKHRISNLTFYSLILLSFSTQASYISPTVYKDHSCEELQEDYLGYLEANFANLSERINASRNTDIKELKKADKEQSAHLKAIKKVSKKKGCPVKTPKELANSKK